jgi:hypothetical protein
MSPAAITTGSAATGAACTTFVAADVALLLPAPLLAVTATRIVLLTSLVVSV